MRRGGGFRLVQRALLHGRRRNDLKRALLTELRHQELVDLGQRFREPRKVLLGEAELRTAIGAGAAEGRGAEGDASNQWRLNVKNFAGRSVYAVAAAGLLARLNGRDNPGRSADRMRRLQFANSFLS